MEDGHTLHLVARQPAQPQTSSGTPSGEANANTNGQGIESFLHKTSYWLYMFMYVTVEVGCAMSMLKGKSNFFQILPDET